MFIKATAEEQTQALAKNISNTQLKDLFYHLVNTQQLIFKKSTTSSEKSILIEGTYYTLKIDRKDIEIPSFFSKEEDENTDIPTYPPPLITL